MSTERYGHILAQVHMAPWAILPSMLATILSILEFRGNGGRLSADEIRARIGTVAQDSQRAAVDSIAVIPVRGTIIPRGGMFVESSGAISAERLTAQIREALQNPAVASIVLDIDSPGGQVNGVAELADEIYSARGQKPIIGVANHLAASAAYWIGSAAGELVVTPTGEVGSIGVFAAHQDRSGEADREGVRTTYISAGKYKTEGNPYEPLTDEARAAIQERVDDYYGLFVRAVARNRGVKAQDVRDGFGEGRVVGARKALELGMVDRIDTLDGVVARLSRPQGQARRAARAGVEFERYLLGRHN